jgi:DNA invertase Pin-like site-specific DNA recombinase
LQKLLKYIKENKDKIDALIVYKLDRLSRDIYDSLSLGLPPLSRQNINQAIATL